MKLERLAKDFLRYDLDTEFGLAQFDTFCHEFDISAGEFTLERTHGFPPAHHTYEELPIIKFDGYDPLGPEAIEMEAAAAANWGGKNYHH